MHQRHGGHRSEVDNESSELGEHFAICGVTNMMIQIVDCVKPGEDEALSILEGYWQNILATFQANENINIRNEWKNYMGQQPILLKNRRCEFNLGSVVICHVYSMIMSAAGTLNMSVIC